jgi:hypothetical protein
MSDWRLQNQESYLKGITLYRAAYQPYRVGWDHDHCEFCGRKFAIDGGDFTEGYATQDRYHWVCIGCYEDFKQRFDWKVVRN